MKIFEDNRKIISENIVKRKLEQNIKFPLNYQLVNICAEETHFQNIYDISVPDIIENSFLHSS